AFPEPGVHVSSLAGPGGHLSKGADDPERIRASLSVFYDRGFVDPATWTKGVPSNIWAGFTNGAAVKANSEASSLTLGKVSGLEHLRVTNARLVLNFLLDTKRRPTAAFATIVF